MEEIQPRLPRPLVGLISLAVGVDQSFADIVKFAEGHDRDAYLRLLHLSRETRVLPTAGSERDACFRAGKQVVGMAELLITVWDGQPAAGLGGTGDVAQFALSCGKPLIHLNPTTLGISTHHGAHDV